MPPHPWKNSSQISMSKSRSWSNEVMNFRHLIYKRCDLDNLQQSVKWNYNHKQALSWILKHKIQNTLKWVSVLRQFNLKMMFGEQNSMLLTQWPKYHKLLPYHDDFLLKMTTPFQSLEFTIHNSWPKTVFT